MLELRKRWRHSAERVLSALIFPFGLRLVRRQSFELLQMAEFSFRDTVHNATQGIIRTSRDGHFIFSNPAFAHMLGYQSAGDLLSSITDVSRQVYVEPEVRRDFLERLARDKRARCEYQAWKKDGSKTWLNVSSRVVEGRGGFLYYESIAEDISERRNRETELAAAVKALERSNAELERFAFVVAHDLNEPLRTIRTYAGLLKHAYREQLRSPDEHDSATEAISFISEATSRMKTLIDDILSFSKVDFRPAVAEAVDMNEVLSDVLANLQAAGTEAGAEFYVADLPCVQAQKAKMERLLQNLISNAIKFRRDTPLKISVDAIPLNDHWKFSVRDNGIGFDSKYAEKIFEFFVQLDRRRYTGSGMGLAMCKRIVEVYGGKIWAESKPGEGTSFYFTLPKVNSRRSHNNRLVAVPGTR